MANEPKKNISWGDLGILAAIVFAALLILTELGSNAVTLFAH